MPSALSKAAAHVHLLLGLAVLAQVRRVLAHFVHAIFVLIVNMSGAVGEKQVDIFAGLRRCLCGIKYIVHILELLDTRFADLPSVFKV